MFETKNNQRGDSSIFIMILMLVFAGAMALLLSTTPLTPTKPSLPIKQILGQLGSKKIIKFTSEDDFKNYLKLSSELNPSYVSTGNTLESVDYGTSDMVNLGLGSNAPVASKEMAGGGTADRVSTTNVQVIGIDEPDVIKTDGQEIYFSGEQYYWAQPMTGLRLDTTSKIMPPQQESKIRALKAWPVADLGLDSEIIDNGKLLLDNNKLIVFSNQAITAYDVADPKKISLAWTHKFTDNNYLVAARLYKNKLYIITGSSINHSRPCPITPLEGTTMRCMDIYHPFSPTAVDTTFTVLGVNPATGQTETNLSFVGSAQSSVVYMSEKSLYVSYTHDTDSFDFMLDFLVTKTKDLMPADIFTKLNKLATYDLNPQTKMTELGILMQDWLAGLSDDEALRVNNEMQNRITSYYETKKRDLLKTEVVRIDLEKFNVAADGLVPGHPLNQYSLDEYNGYLRIATNLGDAWGLGVNGSQASANDVYILDQNLNLKGSLKDLGLTERIYAVRFIKDRGYVVTFRQTDPFYVLDLSNPTNPLKKGELKIPGYSSYLHPLAENKLLGIGQEAGQVKLSLFDVSDPANPQEISKYNLKDYGSESLYDPHAFLQDEKHKIFFIPGSQGAYIFSYDNSELKLAKALSRYNVKRAVYLNDYLYVLAADGVVVLNELDWQEVNKLDFKS